MSYVHQPNTGSLFKNDKREKETHPNAKGSAVIDGVDYWVSAWTNDAKDGSKYQSLKFSKKDENKAPNRPREPGSDDDFETTEIPF